MQIFSLFPQILFLAPIVYTLYRAALAAFLIYDASEKYKLSTVHKGIAALEVLAAIGLAMGAYTQGAAMLSAAIFAVQLVFPAYRSYPYSTVLLLLIMSIGQIVLGAGLFSFDIPL